MFPRCPITKDTEQSVASNVWCLKNPQILVTLPITKPEHRWTTRFLFLQPTFSLNCTFSPFPAASFPHLCQVLLHLFSCSQLARNIQIHSFFCVFSSLVSLQAGAIASEFSSKVVPCRWETGKHCSCQQWLIISTWTDFLQQAQDRFCTWKMRDAFVFTY